MRTDWRANLRCAAYPGKRVSLATARPVVGQHGRLPQVSGIAVRESGEGQTPSPPLLAEGLALSQGGTPLVRPPGGWGYGFFPPANNAFNSGGAVGLSWETGSWPSLSRRAGLAPRLSRKTAVAMWFCWTA